MFEVMCFIIFIIILFIIEVMHMSPILLVHATMNCVVWHLFVDS